MVLHFIYILHSEKTNKFYVGETSDIAHRLKLHKEKYYNSAFTKIADDWDLILKHECNDRHEALYLEKFIKKMKSKAFITRLIKNPLILDDILKKRTK